MIKTDDRGGGIIIRWQPSQADTYSLVSPVASAMSVAYLLAYFSCVRCVCYVLSHALSRLRCVCCVRCVKWKLRLRHRR